MRFLINGFWKDDKVKFSNYLVSSSDDIYLKSDDDIFFYGLSEQEIKDNIKLGWSTELEFVITLYTKIKENEN